MGPAAAAYAQAIGPDASSIRRATADDVQAIVALVLAVHRQGDAVLPPLGSEAETQASLAMLVASAEVWVAEASSTLVGMLVLEGEHIGHLYVAPAHQNRGLGSQLLELAKQRRPAQLDLRTAERNLGARRFYERHGFRLRGAVGADLRYEWSPERA